MHEPQINSALRNSVAVVLARAGFISADDEAGQLVARAAGDEALLDSLVARRLTGEPLAWVTGSTTFCGVRVRIDPGVYVPRWQTEQLVHHAVARLPADGVAVDVCTGSGAIACALHDARPHARIVASDVDPVAVECALSNGVDAWCGDLFAPLPHDLQGHVDVVVACAPYVPTPELPLLQRDTFTFESTLAYDGGPDGTRVLRRVLAESRRWLRHGGAILLELGGPQARLLGDELARLGYVQVTVIADEDGDPRGLEATLR